MRVSVAFRRPWPGVAALIFMPDNNSASVQFRSCTWKVDVLEAVFFLIGAVTSLAYPRGWMVALPFVLAAIWLCGRAHHDRGRPYVEVRDGRLTVHAGQRIIHDIDTSLLAGVGGGWNKTILFLKDGRQVAINHTGFATGEEADRFRKFAEGVVYVPPA